MNASQKFVTGNVFCIRVFRKFSSVQVQLDDEITTRSFKIGAQSPQALLNLVFGGSFDFEPESGILIFLLGFFHYIYFHHFDLSKLHLTYLGLYKQFPRS